MPKRHTPEDIERGLTALAVAGNSLSAAEMTGFNDRTIRKWREQHADRFALIEAGRAALIDQSLREEFRKVVFKGTRVSLKALHATEEQLDAGTLKDPAAAARNAATTTGIMQDKLNTMEGRPTSIVVHRSSDDVMRGLAAAGFVDGTALEEDAETAFLPARAEDNARTDVA